MKPIIKDRPKALVQFIQDYRTKPFAWGSNDCAFFTVEWLTRVFGLEPAVAKPLRGTYTTREGAALVLQRLGGLETLIEAYAVEQGWQAIPPAMAQRGHIALSPTEHGPALGVVVGSMVAHPGPEGVAYRPLSEATKAWRIF